MDGYRSGSDECVRHEQSVTSGASAHGAGKTEGGPCTRSASQATATAKSEREVPSKRACANANGSLFCCGGSAPTLCRSSPSNRACVTGSTRARWVRTERAWRTWTAGVRGLRLGGHWWMRRASPMRPWHFDAARRRTAGARVFCNRDLQHRGLCVPSARSAAPLAARRVDRQTGPASEPPRANPTRQSEGRAVRRMDAGELDRGSPLRSEVESLAKEWSASRHIAPMAFSGLGRAVSRALRPSVLRGGVGWANRRVSFGRADSCDAGGWWRTSCGAGERRTARPLRLDTMMCESRDSAFVTLGSAPSAGPCRLGCDAPGSFSGLFTIVTGFMPSSSDSTLPLARRVARIPERRVPDRARRRILARLCGGSLLAFALRSIARHPSAPPLVLALPLVPWIGLLAGLVAFGYSNESGVSRDILIASMDLTCCSLHSLFRSAVRPPARLACTTAAAAVDAVWSVVHLAHSGCGTTVFRVALRSLAALAPCFGAALLAWATSQSIATVAVVNGPAGGTWCATVPEVFRSRDRAWPTSGAR